MKPPAHRGHQPNQGQHKGPAQQHIIAQQFEGPIPPPMMLQQFEAIMPGLADRIVKMSEDSLATAIYSQRAQTDSVGFAVKSEVEDRRTGMWLGFTCIVLCLLMGGFLIYIGRDIAGYASLVTAVALLVGAFFGLRNKSDKD